MATFRPRQDGESLTAYLQAKQAFELANTGTSTINFGSPTPPAIGAGPTAATPTTGAGSGANNGSSPQASPQQYTQIVKTSDSPQVYGQLPNGQWIAFNDMSQLPQGAQITMTNTAPIGVYGYNDYFGGGTTGGGTSSTPGATSTGNPQLDTLYTTLESYLQKLLDDGNKINPNIELTPAEVQTFLDQATNEVSPYYASQIKLLQNDLSASLQSMQKEYDYNKVQSEAKFKADLGTTRENLAGAGLAFSGVRGGQEQLAQTNQQRTLDFSAQQAADAAGAAIRGTESKVGSGNLPSFSGLGFNAPTVNLSGEGAYGSGRTLDFSGYPGGGVTGSVEYAQRGNIRSLQDFLKNQEIQKRTLSFQG